MPDEVVIAGAGMLTSVGLSAPETAASTRAATMRFTAIDWFDHRFEPFTVAAVLEDGMRDLDEDLEKELALGNRERRLLRLGATALLECLPESSKRPWPPLVLALPDRETALPLDRKRFVSRFARQTKGAFEAAGSTGEFRGRAGGLLAIGRAVEMIRGGQAPWVVAGGIDTYVDLYVLATLDLEKRVKSSAHLDGFIPGEGAGFVLLAGKAAAESAGVKPWAAVSAAARGFEAGHLYSEAPYQGDGLASAVAALLQQNPLKTPVQEVFSSMNGERHWAKEWGVSFLRNRAAFDEGHGMHHPADCYGDTGAACGPLMVGLASLGISRGYRRSPCLVYASSDTGERAVLAVQSLGS